MELKQREHSKLDFYLAMIAAEVRRGWVSDPKKVSMSDLLLEVGPEASPQTKVDKSKAAWASLLGIELKPEE